MKWNVLSRLNHYGFLLNYIFTTRFCHQAYSIFYNVFSLQIYYVSTQGRMSQNRTGKFRSEKLGRINNEQGFFLNHFSNRCFLICGFWISFFLLKNSRDELWLVWLSWLGVVPQNERLLFPSRQGTCLAWGFGPQSKHILEAGDRCFSLTLMFLSLYFCL